MFYHSLFVCNDRLCYLDLERVIDWLLYEGDIVLHRIGLAICKIKQDSLLTVSQFTSLYDIFMTPISHTKTGDRSRVVPSAWGVQWGTMSRDDLYRFREEVAARLRT